jgi:hypothetical protein
MGSNFGAEYQQLLAVVMLVVKPKSNELRNMTHLLIRPPTPKKCLM